MVGLAFALGFVLRRARQAGSLAAMYIAGRQFAAATDPEWVGLAALTCALLRENAETR